MKKPLILVALVLVAGLGLLSLRGEKTPEEKIRALLVGMEKDFNRGRSGPCSEALTDGYRDQSGIGKADFRAMIAQAWFSQRDSKTKEFLYAASLPVEEMQITIDPDDPQRAAIEMTATFFRLRGSEWKVAWKARVRAKAVEEEDGWKLDSSEHTTLEGRPFR